MKKLYLLTEENIVILEKRTTEVGGLFSASRVGGGRLLETRTDGSFKYRAFWLSSGYDWIIGKDEQGHVILVPLSKD
ncbi:MAG: hypothetical protein Q8M94_15205 [Ignavibacteria bacterium]|nr:hypothetical protein [Ignavibacteria bacterium]